MKPEMSSDSSDPEYYETDSECVEGTDDELVTQRSWSETNLPKNTLSFYILGATLWATYTSVICALQDTLAGTERSTGLMLTAAVAPAFVVKIMSPIFLKNVAYMARIMFMFMFVTAGILCTVFSGAGLVLKVAGVCLISAGTGAGETSLLILAAARYHQSTLCSYIAGSGSGAVMGSLLYVGLTTWSNIDPCSALLVTAAWPTIFMLTYALLRNMNYHDVRFKRTRFRLEHYSREIEDEQRFAWMKLPFVSERSCSIWHAAPFLLALFLAYFAEYTSFGAILTTVVFPAKDGGEGLAPRTDYEHYLLSLYTGEFLGRSLFCMLKGLVPSFKSKRVWIVLFSPLAIMIFFVYMAWYRFVDSIWLVFFLCFLMGVTAGTVHASSYIAIARNTLPDHVEVVLALATISEAAGMLIAGLLGLHSEQYLYWHCRYSTGHTTMRDCLSRSSNPLFWAEKTRWLY